MGLEDIEHLENKTDSFAERGRSVAEAIERVQGDTKRAREIASNLELFDRSLQKEDLRATHILDRLRGEGLLEFEVARVKDMFETRLGDFGERLDQKSWELLTELELFDPGTAYHCVETYRIARGKVESQLFNGMVLADSFEEEGVPLDTFYTACLLHDVGKIEVPHSVVTDTTSDFDCATLLYEKAYDTVLLPTLRKYTGNPSFNLPEQVTSPSDLLRFLHNELHIRPQEITPFYLLVGETDPEKVTEIAQQLEHCGCSLDDPLLTIMRKHDAYSAQILDRAGKPVEAKLAGSHHQNKEHIYRVTIGTLRVNVDLADIIHLADVENAIASKRSYKESLSELEMLKILAIHAKQKVVDEYIAYIWIADTFKNIQRESLKTPDDHATYDFIMRYLNEQKLWHLAYPEWDSTLVHAKKERKKKRDARKLNVPYWMTSSHGNQSVAHL